MVCLFVAPQWSVSAQEKLEDATQRFIKEKIVRAMTSLGASSWLACPATVWRSTYVPATTSFIANRTSFACGSAQHTALLRFCPLTRNRRIESGQRIVTMWSLTYLPTYLPTPGTLAVRRTQGVALHGFQMRNDMERKVRRLEEKLRNSETEMVPRGPGALLLAHDASARTHQAGWGLRRMPQGADVPQPAKLGVRRRGCR